MNLNNKRRIVICADIYFPHYDAGSNRILNYARALSDEGYEVIILGCEKQKATSSKDNKDYRNIYSVKYKNIVVGQSALKTVLDKKILSGVRILHLLKKCKPNSSDKVIVYGSNSSFTELIVNYCKKKSVSIYIDVVERHCPFQYSKGKKDIRYISSNKTFTEVAPRCDGIIAISNYIANYYKSKGHNNVEVFPVMIDGADGGKASFEKKESFDFIYPGNPEGKDNISTVLKSFAELSSEGVKFVFHFTGVTKERIISLLKEDAHFLYELGDKVIFHGWMEYDELQNLYEKIDYLIISRPDNIVTRANFPSKVPELMIKGVVPVVNRVGEYCEYLNDTVDSFLFTDDETEQCKAAIRRAVSVDFEKMAEMKRNAKETAEREFDFRKWRKKLADFLN